MGDSNTNCCIHVLVYSAHKFVHTCQCIANREDCVLIVVKNTSFSLSLFITCIQTHSHTHIQHTHSPQTCIMQKYDTREVNVCQNQQLADEFALNIRNIFLFLESRIGEANEIGHRQKLVGFCGLLVLHNQLYNAPDRKLARQVWDVYKKVRIIIY